MRVKQLGDPVLRKVSNPVDVDDIQSGKFNPVIEQMCSVLNGIQAISPENGNAISAPQIGSHIRLVLLRIDGEFLELFNPSFTPLDETTFLFEEECFSFYQIRGKVLRHLHIQVDYLDRHGKQQSIAFSGEFSGIAQHEIDHLDGVLFIDRVEDTQTICSIDYVYAKQPKRLQQVKRMFEYMVG